VQRHEWKMNLLHQDHPHEGQNEIEVDAPIKYL